MAARCALLVLLWVAGTQVQAQPIYDGAASEQFRSALIAFESREYEVAYRRFVDVFNREPVHTRTTAALLMAGKALYRMGDYARALEVLGSFHRDYPTSRYLREASQVMAFARLEMGKAERVSAAVRIGVALPLTGVDPALSRSLFSGIRYAVDYHNARGRGMVQLIFRDTQNSPAQARRAVVELAGEGADAIIGPLFSQEVLAAAREAERAEVVLVAPLATDDRITRGSTIIFQANAILAERGAFMARAAVNRLGLSRLGVVAQAGKSVSMARARGFTEAVLREGAELEFNVLLESSSDWLRLPELIGAVKLDAVDGLYLSVDEASDQDIARVAEGILTRLGRSSARPHILGASAWHEVEKGPFAQNLKVSYMDVQHINELSSEVRSFIQGYRAANEGAAPDRLAYVGYDVTRLLLQYVGTTDDLASSLRSGARYDGVAIRIRFDEDQRNEALFLFHHSPNGGILAN
ncbi:MAG: ABC transporter substrate-binding protein [Bacteroidota bacterium]|nr:ABC transporter substrate-binding protein [Bacteroidota bacterium]